MDENQRKQFIKEIFNRVATGYDNAPLRFFQQSAALLPQYLALNGNEHVLDAASGTGAAALELAQALPDGKVTAVDMSEGMLAQAKVKAGSREIQNIDFILMDIENLKFDDNHFDRVNCSFGLFFLEDMERLLKQLVTKLKPGGKFSSCCFTENSFCPHTTLFYERLEKYGVDVPAAPGFIRLADESKSTALYETAALSSIKTFQHNVGYIQKNADEWWDVVWNAGYRGFVEQLDEGTLAVFKQEHLKEINQLSTSSGIPFEVEVIFTIGEKK